MSNVLTIQRTGKKWKALKVLANLGGVIGIILLMIYAQGVRSPELLKCGSWTLGTCVFLGVFARLGIWWNHS